MANITNPGALLFNGYTEREVDCYRCHNGDGAVTWRGPALSKRVPKLSDALRAKGKGSCTVSDARPYGGTNTGASLIEVACSDGGPGWVIEFPKGSNTASELLNCAQASGMGGGGCQLATNKK